VKFAPGGAVVRAAYLDDYPFPFYVVVRDVRTLPDVLADAVRQWFEASAGGA
jgi:midasin